MKASVRGRPHVCGHSEVQEDPGLEDLPHRTRAGERDERQQGEQRSQVMRLDVLWSFLLLPLPGPY